MTAAATNPATGGVGDHGGSLRYDPAGFARHLTQGGKVSESDIRVAREVARRNGVSELRALLDIGLISENDMAAALSAWSGRPRWNAEEETGSPSEGDAGVPLEFMRSHGVLVLEDLAGAGAEVEGGAPGARVIKVVVADPSDHLSWSAVRSRLEPLGRPIALWIGTQREIAAFLSSRPGVAPGEGGAGAAVDGEMIDVAGEISALRDMASEAPVIRFFNQAVDRAMELGASDIHLERYDRRVSLRFRVDGVLVDQPPPPLAMHEALLCRIKIMSSLDIAERRRAQDGRIRMRLRGRAVDMRVSIVPTTYGQDAAIRIQDRQKLADIKLEDLGFDPTQIDRLYKVASKNHGILLITGPTGSGKTTTLYAMLRRLVNTETKVVTVEDPVEYQMDGVTQIQVNPAINLTFGNTLRNILRHDPDTILIGEVRDKETAEMAFQASLTGHMVLSTLHTNDVPGTFVRLVDMGVEPYLVNAAVEGVSAQRLIRRLCPACHNQEPARETCRTCLKIGYRGRVAVMEFSGVSSAIKRAMLQGAEEHRIREVLLQEGYLPLRADAQRLIDAKITDEAEVVRALGAAAAGDIE